MENKKTPEDIKNELIHCSYVLKESVKGQCPFTRFYENKVVFVDYHGGKSEFLYMNPRAGIYNAEFLKFLSTGGEAIECFNKILLYNRYIAKDQPVSVIDKETSEFYHIDDKTGHVYKNNNPVGYFLLRAVEISKIIGKDKVRIEDFEMPLSDYVDAYSELEFSYIPRYRDMAGNYYMNEWRN